MSAPKVKYAEQADNGVPSGGTDGQVLTKQNDGSAAWENAGDNYVLPQAIETALGGVKAKAKTTENGEVAIDSATGKLYAPAADAAANGIPSGGTAGQILSKIDATNYNAQWVTPIRATSAAAKVYATTAQSIPNITWTSIAYDAELFDNDSIHNNSTNNTRLTCKTAGRYLVGGQLGFAVNTNGNRFGRIYKNGNAYLVSASVLPPIGAFSPRIVMSTITDLEVNDYIELQAYQDSGDYLNIEGTAEYRHFYMIQMSV